MLEFTKIILQCIYVLLWYNLQYLHYKKNTYWDLSTFGWFLIEFIKPLCIFLLGGGIFDFSTYFVLILKL